MNDNWTFLGSLTKNKAAGLVLDVHLVHLKF